MLIPIALVGWHSYRILAIEGFRPPEPSLNAYIYALLLSPHADRVVPMQGFLWPWDAIGRALWKLWMAPDVDLVVNLTLAAWFLLLLARAWSRMAGDERLYTLAVVLSAFSYHTGPVHPYMGLPRHLWIAFPVFLKAPPANQLRFMWILVHAIAYFFCILVAVLKTWVP